MACQLRHMRVLKERWRKTSKLTIMYKVIEVPELIGSICIEKEEDFTISIDNIKSIMSEVRTRDQFVSTRLTNRSIMHANQLVGNEVASTSFSIPSSDRVRNEFIREFYRMDLETRDLLKEIIKLHISEYGL